LPSPTSLPAWSGRSGPMAVPSPFSPRRPDPEGHSRAHPGTARARERDGETGRTGAGPADNKCGLRGRCQRLADRRADSVMARNPRGFHSRGRRYVCSPPGLTTPDSPRQSRCSPVPTLRRRLYRRRILFT
jgi:hypothetical protein